MTPASPTLRFAPSPNGYLHLGHAYSALLNRSMADRLGGNMLLRMEDIDRDRCREEYAAAIEEDLRWLGVGWSEPVRRQSEHFPFYAEFLRDLVARGLVFPCFCTRAGIREAVAAEPGWPTDPDGAPLYPGICKRLSRAEAAREIAAGRRAAYRLDMGAALACIGAEPLHWHECGENDRESRLVMAEPAQWGDALIARKDMPTTYHLAVVADDASQAVSDVVRGLDLLAATGLHRLLQALLGFSAPRYHHHRLILDQHGRKLSKSRRAPSLRELRHAGARPSEIRQRLGFS